MKNLILIISCILFLGCNPSKTGTPINFPTPTSSSTPVSIVTPNPEQPSPKPQLGTTPKGVKVVGNFTSAQLLVIDEAFTELFADAKAFGYPENSVLHYNHYQVNEVACTPSPETGTFSFSLRADNYDGSIYDQYNPKGSGVKDGIGMILASEQIISYTPTVSFKVCTDSSVLKNVTRYGGEHGILRVLDPMYYAQTETHLTKGHPLIPK